MQEREKRVWREWFRDEDVKAICKYLFQIVLTPKQEQIVRAVAFSDRNVVISCATRYGKSFCVSMGILIYILINKNKRVLLVSPKYDQTMIIRNYIADFLQPMMKCDEAKTVLQLTASGIEKIKREVSRRRITYTNGCETMTLSAEGDASRLMGFGGDLIILDEDCKIPYETYRSYIGRMMMDNPDSRMIEIGNPWDRLNQMYQHWINPDYDHIHIGYKDGIREGRYSEKKIEEQKQELTPYEFTVLWEAEFPEEAEDSLLKYSWVEQAYSKGVEIKDNAKTIAGLDVAEAGIDHTVLITGLKEGNKYKVCNVAKWDKADTMATAGIVGKQIDNKTTIHVDAIGVGKGVADRLREVGKKVVEIKVGMAATREKDRFLNQKSQFYFGLRGLFESGQIEIPEDPRLIGELMQMRYELTSSGKIKIIDPDKSPDYADALMLMCAQANVAIIDYDEGDE
jgi:hypothetical protein